MQLMNQPIHSIIYIHSDLICLNVMSKCFSFLANCGILVMKKREGGKGTKDISGEKIMPKSSY